MQQWQFINNFNQLNMFRAIVSPILRSTYLLTPWCRVLLEKLIGLQLVKKFPAFHGTPRFITALTSVRHLSLSWASPIQSIYSHPISWRSIIILSTHLRLGLPCGLLPSGFPARPYTPPSPHTYAPSGALDCVFYSLWYKVPTMLPAGDMSPAGSIVGTLYHKL